MYLIRNIQIRRLVTDGKRVPLNFETRDQATIWLHRNGDPDFLTITDIDSILNPEEQKQLLKVNFQEVK